MFATCHARDRQLFRPGRYSARASSPRLRGCGASPGSYGYAGYGALEGDVVTCFISSELNSIFTSQISLVAFSLVYNYIRTPTAHWLHFGVSEPRDDAVRCPHTSGPSVVSGYYSSTGCSSTNTTVCSRAREQGRRHKGHHQGQRLG